MQDRARENDLLTIAPVKNRSPKVQLTVRDWDFLCLARPGALLLRMLLCV